LISHLSLKQLTKEVFVKLGMPEGPAEIASENLIKADLRGIDSHGVARLSGYVRLIKAGRINVSANPKIIHETPSTATLDGDSGLGLYVANPAIKIAIEKAKTAGSGWVAVQNSSHFGIAAAHAELALEHDMIGFAMTNASPLVVPAGAVQPYLGTNPICVTIPTGNHLPFILDMATAAAANGKLEIAQRKEKSIPTGWAQTREGETTDDPHALKNGGTLLPLGSDIDHGYHKGYGLGAWVDIFSGVLSGANFGGWVPPFVSFLGVKESVGKGIGHFVGAWRVDAFQPANEFKSRMDTWINGIKKLERKNGIEEVLIPGEPEHRAQEVRLKEGVPVNEKVIADLKEIAGELGVAFEIGN
jgi:L-2-hydroxycarboxylate dehydrogenase (NAD+)